MNEQRRKLFNIPEPVVSDSKQPQEPSAEEKAGIVMTPDGPMTKGGPYPAPLWPHSTFVSRYIKEPDGLGVILSYLCPVEGVIDNMTMVIGSPDSTVITQTAILTAGKFTAQDAIPIRVQSGKNILPGEIAVDAGMVIEVKWAAGDNLLDIWTAFRYRTRE